MSNYDFVEKIVDSNKDLKIAWEEMLILSNKHELTKDIVRSFKAEKLLPILEKITGSTYLIIERKRKDLYEHIFTFFKDLTQLSTHFQQQTSGVSFNFSSETELLSYKLLGYEAAVNILMIGAVAFRNENYEFISGLGDQQVIWLRQNGGTDIYRSIYYYPWFESSYVNGNLVTFFEDAKDRLSRDEYIRKRYFSMQNEEHVHDLCKFNFLQAVKLEITKENDWENFPFYPNFARYNYLSIGSLVDKFINGNARLLNVFHISQTEFKKFLSKYFDYITSNRQHIGMMWFNIPEKISQFLGKK